MRLRCGARVALRTFDKAANRNRQVLLLPFSGSREHDGLHFGRDRGEDAFVFCLDRFFYDGSQLLCCATEARLEQLVHLDAARP